MNEKIMRKARFGEEVDRVKEGKCSLCEKEIDTVFAFRDGASKREFAISGLCQECQDKTFGVTRADYWKGCCLKTKGPTRSDMVSYQEYYWRLREMHQYRNADPIPSSEPTPVCENL
ncbi:unnamed protein product [marine sediment metagenome]|uniref:Uncharacterized protein n=1 Tax=marine sediment metagenome TaxID=412755 RepID=X1FWC8_9ZZZZ